MNDTESLRSKPRGKSQWLRTGVWISCAIPNALSSTNARPQASLPWREWTSGRLQLESLPHETCAERHGYETKCVGMSCELYGGCVVVEERPRRRLKPCVAEPGSGPMGERNSSALCFIVPTWPSHNSHHDRLCLVFDIKATRKACTCNNCHCAVLV